MPHGADFDFDDPSFSIPETGAGSNVTPKKKKKPVTLPVTALPQITTPAPTPVSQEVTAFRERLAEIVAGFSQQTAAIATPTPATALQGRFAPTPTLLDFEAPAAPAAPVPPPVPPPVPTKVPAQGVTPAQAAGRQRSRAAATAKPKTILTSGRGLLDVGEDESRRARKTLLGA